VRRKSSAIMQAVRVQTGTPDGSDVPVLDTGYKQSLAGTRGFGRAGLRVTLAERFVECDLPLPILSLRSRYSAHNVVLLSYADDPAAAVVEFVWEQPKRVVLPNGDGVIPPPLGQPVGPGQAAERGQSGSRSEP
jgi:hypothetical protein